MMDKFVVVNENKTAYRVIDDEAVVVNLENSTFHVLNPVASYIWQMAEKKIQVKDIVKKVSEEFDVDFETAREDCLEFIIKSSDENLLILC